MVRSPYEKTKEEMLQFYKDVDEGLSTKRKIKGKEIPQLQRTKAHRKAKAKIEEELLNKAEEEAKKSPEFSDMIDTILDVEGITTEHKIIIIIQMLSYWITGEQDKARVIYSSLFDPNRTATFIPSE